MPGSSVFCRPPLRRATRWMTRNEYSLSSSTPAPISITRLTADADQRDHQRDAERRDVQVAAR